MIKIYVELIKKGKRTIDQVPASILEAVKSALEAES